MTIKFGGESVTPRQFAKLALDDAAQSCVYADTSEFEDMTPEEGRKVREALQKQADRIHKFLLG